jgi:hypothetical protein
VYAEFSGWSDAPTLVQECHAHWDWDGMWDGRRGFWLVSFVPLSRLQWHSKDVVTSGRKSLRGFRQLDYVHNPAIRYGTHALQNAYSISYFPPPIWLLN